jgi:hypothetical protein
MTAWLKRLPHQKDIRKYAAPRYPIPTGLTFQSTFKELSHDSKCSLPVLNYTLLKNERATKQTMTMATVSTMMLPDGQQLAEPQ